MSELADQTTDHVGKLCPLTDHELAGPMLAEHSLLIGRLDGHKPHRGPGHGFTDGFSIGRIGFPALDVRLHIGRWHELHIMPQLG